MKCMLDQQSASNARGGEASWISQTNELVGIEEKGQVAPAQAVERFRLLIAPATNRKDTGPVVGPRCSTAIRASLLQCWQRKALDPDNQVGPRLFSGAPCGILEHPIADGIFPVITDENRENPDGLATDFESFSNYAGVEGDPDAESEIIEHIEAGHILASETVEGLLHATGGQKPILNKIGIIDKIRDGIRKRRLILDTKASRLKEHSRKNQRVILPRLLDAILSVLALMALMQPADEESSIELFVLDFADAFWQIPIGASERRFFGAQLTIKGKLMYLLFLRAVQGSRSAPLSWARVIALVIRLTQSLFDPKSVRLMCFVDDPLAVIVGTPAQRALIKATIITTWEALGFALSYHKGQSATTVVWIGGTISTEKDCVIGSIKDGILEDLRSDIKRFASLNVIPCKDLHTFVARLNFAAGLLVTLRPFLQALWAALNTNTGSPQGTIWQKQIVHPVGWLQAFLSNQVKGIKRTFSLTEFKREGPLLEIGTDASPWGLGGYLSRDGCIVEHFASPLTHYDEEVFNARIGSPDGQQIWESLAILVALRLWRNLVIDKRVTLQLKGDNVGSLMLMCRMRPSNSTQAIIAREGALIMADSAFLPDVVHTPGIAHVIADELSRRHSPPTESTPARLHPSLSDSIERATKPRRANWYSALNNFGAASHCV